MSTEATLKAIAQPRREAILRLVWDRERPAGEIAAHFGDVSHAAISQHLRVLKEAGLVTERRDGRRRLYAANPQTLAGVRRYLESFWDAALERLRQAVEEDAVEEDKEGTHDR